MNIMLDTTYSSLIAIKFHLLHTINQLTSTRLALATRRGPIHLFIKSVFTNLVSSSLKTGKCTLLVVHAPPSPCRFWFYLYGCHKKAWKQNDKIKNCKTNEYIFYFIYYFLPLNNEQFSDKIIIFFFFYKLTIDLLYGMITWNIFVEHNTHTIDIKIWRKISHGWTVVIFSDKKEFV